jgi:FkbM family methyltransferase
MNRDFLTQVFVRVVKQTPLSRGAARRLTLGLIQRIHPEPIQCDFRSVPFLFHLDNTTEKKALVSNSYDRTELNFLLGSVQGRPSTFIDIGANSGLYSMFLAFHMYPGSKVIAVEPNPEMCERIASNTSLLRERGFAQGVSIDIQPLALGDASGELYLNLGHGLGPALLQNQKSERSVRVSVETLLQLCEDKGVEQIDAMKIDVEGYEDRVLLPFLSGAERRLLPRALVLETAHRDAWGQDVVAPFLAAGYRMTGQTRSNLLITLGG